MASGAGGYNISQPIAASSTTMVDLDSSAQRTEQANLGLGLTRSAESGESSEFENSLASTAPASKFNGSWSPGYFQGGSGGTPGTADTEPKTPTVAQSSPFAQSGNSSGGYFAPSYSLRQATSMSTIQANSPTSAVAPNNREWRPDHLGAHSPSPRASPGLNGPALPPRPGQVAAGEKAGDATNKNGHDPEFSRALSRLADVLPDVDEDILVGYLRRAGGRDGDEVRAIGEYLGDKAAGRIKPGNARR